ncbi:MAG: hypothetical protein PW791_03680 [Neorhizobium sp.]|nr:hypothetical protein [Neorhizobium sp.]
MKNAAKIIDIDDVTFAQEDDERLDDLSFEELSLLLVDALTLGGPAIAMSDTRARPITDPLTTNAELAALFDKVAPTLM